MAVVEAHFQAGVGTVIEPGSVVGQPYDGWREPAVLGDDCRVLTASVIYADTRLGNHTRTGVGVLIREFTEVGEGCLIGSQTILDGHCRIGQSTVLQSGVYVPSHVLIGDRVFVGPRAVLTNDRYPLRRRSEFVAAGPTIEDDATIGANATLLPGIRVGCGSVVGAGAVVTRDVPEWSLAVGVPARILDLPERLKERNEVKRRW
jgi:acetyltransferase-like isoleucine patch superfamily enzyme